MTKLFNDKGFWKTAFKLAMPVALQNMLTSSFTLVDTLFVSSLGDEQLASVGMAGQWGWLMNMVIFGTCSATGVFVAQYWGAKDKQGIRKTMGIALSFSLLVSAVFFVMSFFLPHIVIGMFNRDKTIIEYGSSYLTVIAFTYPAIAVLDVLSVVLRSTEKVRIPMYVSVVTTGLNIFFDYALIFGKLGFPQMGIRGAALATLISEWLGVAFLILVSYFQKNIIITKISNVFSFTKKDISVFAKRAVPVIINETLWGSGTFVFNLIFANMGYEYFAAITIQRSFENISYVFFIGLCSACSVMVGKSVGKGDIDTGIKDSRRFLIIVPAAAVIVGAISVIFKTPLVGIFDMGNNISELTLRSAESIIMIYGIEMPVRTLGFVFVVGILRSGGDTSTAAKIDLTGLWLFSIPATLIAAYVFKAPFLICFIVMYLAEDYVKIIMCLVRYKSKKWIKPVTEMGQKGLEEYFYE